jgi:hypothetical protein
MKTVPVRILAVAACLALSAAVVGIAIAAEDPQAPAPAESPPPTNVGTGGRIMDKTHAYLEENILKRVVWFDDFFGSVKSEDSRQPEYSIRWRNSLRWDEGGKFQFLTSARARVRLPKLSHRMHLVISGESEAEPSPGLPEDPGNPGFDRTLPKTRLVNTELRYGVLKRPDVDLYLGAGVRIRIPLESFVRSRFQYTRPLGDVALLRFGETLFWKNTVGFGETTEVDLERALGPKTLLRWSNSGTIAQESNGLGWGTDLSLLQQLSPRSAITFGGGIFGDTRPAAVVGSYKVYIRYRRNFLRSWLFFELEPEVFWTRTPQGSYPVAYASTFRIEVVFQGKAAPKEEKIPVPGGG